MRLVSLPHHPHRGGSLVVPRSPRCEGSECRTFFADGSWRSTARPYDRFWQSASHATAFGKPQVGTLTRAAFWSFKRFWSSQFCSRGTRRRQESSAEYCASGGSVPVTFLPQESLSTLNIQLFYY